MRIDVALNPAEIGLLPGRDLSATTCIIFDVLRATSSMITALAHGAAAIHPARTIDEAMTLKARMPEAVLGGERHGEKINGFDVGNSPFEYRENVAGRAIISTTTNGTIALRACERAQRVLVGAMLNLSALAVEIARSKPELLLLVCAGTFANFALEDGVAAGMLIGLLPGATLTDSAQAAVAITSRFPEAREALFSSTNGKVLAAKGRAEEVEWCAQVSRYSIVAKMENAVIRSC